MQAIAKLELGESRELEKFLRKKSIACEVQVSVHESGMEFGEILVEDDVCDRACEITEAWDSERRAAAQRMSKMWCDKCYSHHLGLVPNDTLGYTFRCKDCGYEFSS